MFNFASNFFELKNCIICGKYNKKWICDNCKKRLKKYEKYKLFIKDEAYYDKVFYCYTYKGLIRKLLIQYKFRGKSYLCNFFAKMLLNCKKTYGFFSFYDIIIPVPMDKQKQLIRGYNQTSLITKIIVQNTGIADGNRVIKKIKKTKTQSTLNEIQRKENVKDAFGVENTNQILNKRVIVFDDIYTTGATVNEISKVLKESGAIEVLVLVLAKD